MQPTVVRVRPTAGRLPETFRVSDAEGAVQDQPVEMVSKHAVLSGRTRWTRTVRAIDYTHDDRHTSNPSRGFQQPFGRLDFRSSH